MWSCCNQIVGPNEIMCSTGCKEIFSWVKVFRIIPEFRILRLTFHFLKMLNSADYYRFSDLFSVCLKTIDHLSLKYLVGILQVLRWEV